MSNETRIIVCGGRDFDYTDYLFYKLNDTLRQYSNVTLVTGAARGADQLAEYYAERNDIPIKVFPADWSNRGPGAGYIRNHEMLKYAQKEYAVLIAFWDGKSRGTQHMIDIAIKAGVDVHIFPYKK